MTEPITARLRASFCALSYEDQGQRLRRLFPEIADALDMLVHSHSSERFPCPRPLAGCAECQMIARLRAAIDRELGERK